MRLGKKPKVLALARSAQIQSLVIPLHVTLLVQTLIVKTVLLLLPSAKLKVVWQLVVVR
jgi:hypothetical protein